MMPEENKNSKANEPQPEYRREITILRIKSFEEMNEYDAKEIAKFTSLEHLQHATDMIKRIHAEELKKEMGNLTITFLKPWK